MLDFFFNKNLVIKEYKKDDTSPYAIGQMVRAMGMWVGVRKFKSPM